MAMHVEGKYYRAFGKVQQRILETGDEDMVRVPGLTVIELIVEGEQKSSIYRCIHRIAEGAALMAGCKAEYT